MSDQLSSAATRMPAALAAAASAARSVPERRRRQQVDAGEGVERLGHGHPLGLRERVDGLAAERQRWRRPRPRRRAASRPAQSAISCLVRLVGAVPFEHGELGMVQGPALAVAEDVGEGEQARLAGGQQLLAGELGRGVQVEPALRRAVGGLGVGREGVQVGLVAGRDLQDRRGRPRRSRGPRTSGAAPPGCGRGRAGTGAGRRGRAAATRARAGIKGSLSLDRAARFRGKGTATLAGGARRRRSS